MQTLFENKNPSIFYQKKNSKSLSPLPSIKTGKTKKKHKKNLLERRKQNNLEFEINLPDINDEVEQRILQFLDENNIVMVMPDEKEHDYLQNNITNIFQKYDKNSGSPNTLNSATNSSSPYKNSNPNSSPALKINNSPLMQKRKESFLTKIDIKSGYSLKLEKFTQSMEDECENEKINNENGVENKTERITRFHLEKEKI